MSGKRKNRTTSAAARLRHGGAAHPQNGARVGACHPRSDIRGPHNPGMQLDPPTLQIRGARPADAQRVASCYLAARKTLLPYAPLPHDDAAVLDWVQQRLLPAGGVTVALEAGAVVGLIAVATRDDGHWIEQLYVHPARWRRGVGSTLLQLSLGRLAGAVRLYCFEPNRDARRFYERFGFTAIGFGDGSGNESQCPDVLYERQGAAG